MSKSGQLQADGSVMFQPSIVKLTILSVFSAAMGIFGVYWASHQNTEPSIIPWFCAAFFILCAVVLGVQLVPGASYLRLTAEGFEVCSLFRKSTVKWSAAANFRVIRMVRGRKMVAYDQLKVTSPIVAVNRFLVEADAGLPDTYGMKAQELADLLNEWRYRYVPQGSSSQASL